MGSSNIITKKEKFKYIEQSNTCVTRCISILKYFLLINANFLGKICKDWWTNIRDGFRKSIKKTTSGQAAKKNEKIQI